MLDAEPDLVVCATATSVPEALAAIERKLPDLVVTDLTMAGRGGLDLIKDLVALHPELRILVCSMHDETLYAERALRAGAMGYLMKQEAGEKIIAAIQRLLQGDIYLSDKIKEKMLHRFVNKKGDNMVFSIDTLSDREMEVFQLIGNGYSTRQIAQKLNLSSKTIDSYREHLKLKLNLDSGAELVRHAIQWARNEGSM